MFIIAPIIKIVNRAGYSGISINMVINLGKNPVNGGMPLIDRISKGADKRMCLCVLQAV